MFAGKRYGTGTGLIFNQHQLIGCNETFAQNGRLRKMDICATRNLRKMNVFVKWQVSCCASVVLRKYLAAKIILSDLNPSKQVNAGPMTYAEAFLRSGTGVIISPHHRKRLIEEYERFVVLSAAALETNQNLLPPPTNPPSSEWRYHESLFSGFNQIKTALASMDLNSEDPNLV